MSKGGLEMLPDPCVTKKTVVLSVGLLKVSCLWYLHDRDKLMKGHCLVQRAPHQARWDVSYVRAAVVQ